MSSDNVDVAGGRFKTFVVFDMETANIPSLNYNKVGITEISCYGFSPKDIEEANFNGTIPDLPRVLNKLTLMINPRMKILPEVEKITGLNNFMLEHENSFDNNAGETLLHFLNHLQQPVCLVSHNGLNFDFPNIKHVFDKIKLTIPDTVYCCDSLRAFHDIDLLKEPQKSNNSDKENDEENVKSIKSEKPEEPFDAQARNETTPTRPTSSVPAAAIKRKRNATEDDTSDNEIEEVEVKKEPSSKRRLDFGASTSNVQQSGSKRNISYLVPSGKKWFPPKKLYKLDNLYSRTFQQEPKETHRAEADVLMLTHLMLHYGKDFIDYAEKFAVQLNTIPGWGFSRI